MDATWKALGVARERAKPVAKFTSSLDCANYLKNRYHIRVSDETGGTEPVNLVIEAVAEVLDDLCRVAAVDEAVTSYGFEEIVLKAGDGLNDGGQQSVSMAHYVDDKATLYIAAREARAQLVGPLTAGVGQRDVGLGFKTLLAQVVGHVSQTNIEITAKRVMAIIYDTMPKSYWEREISTYCGTSSMACFAEAYAAYTHKDYGSFYVLPAVLVAMFEAAGIAPNVVDAQPLSKADDTDPSNDKPKAGLQSDGSIITDSGYVIPASTVAAVVKAAGDLNYDFLVQVMTPAMRAAFQQAGYGLIDVATFQPSSRDHQALFNVVDQGAVEYADERAAELVTQISDSTRNMIRGQVTDALKEGWSKKELVAELMGNQGFSEYRAKMIAHTELRMAHSYGRIDVAKAAGGTKKKWLLSADHDPNEDCSCSEAEEAGWIDMDDLFVDGDDDYDYPPGHPNCWCDWAANLNGEGEEDDDEDSNGSGDPDDSGGGGAGADSEPGAGDGAEDGDDVDDDDGRKVAGLRGFLRKLEAQILEKRHQQAGGTDSRTDEGSAPPASSMAPHPEHPASRAQTVPLSKDAVDTAAHEAAMSPLNDHLEPTEGQRKAGNYRMGHIVVGGVEISIENPAGTARRAGWTRIAGHYGYIKGTEGADGDHLDVFVKPGTDEDWTGTVYVVNQFRLDGTFDEHKVLLGYGSEQDATQAYLNSYKVGWQMGPVSTLTWAQFKEWIAGDTKQPLSKGDTAGHEFHGNQYTGGMGGPKPTYAQTKGAKGGVHELLSSGHSFSLEELQHATGASVSNLKTALSDLKSDKYAGSYGKLAIVKNPDGTYQVKGAGGMTPAAPASDFETGHAATETETSKVLTKAEADAKYNAQITKNLEAFKEVGSVKLGAQLFKQAKAYAMAQWVKDQGQTPTPVKGTATDQPVFKADENLHANLQTMSTSAAYAQWHQDTAMEKAGKLPGMASKEPTGVKPVAAAAPVDSGKASEGIPKDTVPSDFEQINSASFEATATHAAPFTSSITSSKIDFEKDSYSAQKNKAGVQTQLTNELKDSPNFQALKAALGTSGNTLESTLVQKWAASSGDHEAVSVAMQVAARDVFDMQDNDLSYAALHILNDHQGDTSAVMKAAASTLDYNTWGDSKVSGDLVHAGLKEFVAGMYRNTQNYLASKGIDHMYLARGMKMSASEGAAIKDVKMQPMSSFSTSISVAKNFAAGGSVYLVKVPRSQIVGTYLTGFGCSNEHEVVVLANAKMKSVQVKALNITAEQPKKVAAYVSEHLPKASGTNAVY